MKRLLSYNSLWIWLNAAWLMIGLFILGWNPETVIFVYIFETTIIGLLCIFKMLVLCFWGRQNKIDVKQSVGKNFSEHEMGILSSLKLDKVVYLLYNLFVVAMFAVVFLGFIWGQSIFTFLMASHTNPGIYEGPNRVLHNLSWLFAQPEMQAAFSGVAITHLIALVQQFILPGEYRHITLQQLFVQPWVRIITQQFVVIVGGFVFFKTGNSFVAVAALLVIVKTVVDVFVVQSMERKATKDLQMQQDEIPGTEITSLPTRQ